MSEAEKAIPQFLYYLENSIGGSIERPSQMFSRNQLISLFHANFADRGLFSEVIDLCFYHGYIDAANKLYPVWENYHLTARGREFLRDPAAFSLDERQSAEKLQQRIDSTDWTGLAKKLSLAQKVAIRSKANELLALVIQSAADENTRLDACKRVEAVITLLDAPNSPWREIVSLLNHPVLNAFFAATSLAQFIVGIAH